MVMHPCISGVAGFGGLDVTGCDAVVSGCDAVVSELAHPVSDPISNPSVKTIDA
jgi:alcohol dehydrogenase class IV